MNEQIFECIQGLFRESCIDLFESFDCDIQQSSEGMNIEGSPIATISADSGDLEISIYFQIPYQALALSYPVISEGCDIGEEMLEDWVLEIANQLLGRFKNKLVNHDCHLRMGLPDSKFGVELDQLVPDVKERFCNNFCIEGDYGFRTHTCLTLFNEHPRFSLHEQHNTMNEGDIELF